MLKTILHVTVKYTSYLFVYYFSLHLVDIIEKYFHRNDVYLTILPL